MIKNNIFPVVNWNNKYQIFILLSSPNDNIVIVNVIKYDITMLYFIDFLINKYINEIRANTGFK